MTKPANGQQSKFYPVSFAQQQMWLLDRLDPGNPAYNIARALRIRGPLSSAILRQSLEAIVARHESLRTRFTELDGEPVQLITGSGDPEFTTIDLKGLPQAQRDAETLRLAREETQRPFDLASGPLLRAALICLGRDEHVLILVLHHIVTDGWSMGILLREVAQFYEDLSLGRALTARELPIQYGEYAVRQREALRGETFDGHLAYWRSHLAGVEPVLDLPSDLTRPAVRTSAGATERVIFPPELCDGLKALSREANATLFMTLLAAFQVLLSRYTSREDLVVGSPSAGRSELDLEPLIGFFVNTLVLRTDLSGNPPFRELLGRAREVALDAYAHQDVPVEKVIDQVQVPRSLSYTPLFQVMFILQNAPRQAINVGGLTFEEFEFESGTAKFDLTLEMAEIDEGLACSAEYSTDVLDQSAVARLLDHFGTLLRGIVADPGQRLLDLSLMSEEERHRVLVEWNDTKADYASNRSIPELFEKQVERTPESVALREGTRSVTYAELNRSANQLAAHLQRQGVAPGAIVAIFADRSIEATTGILAILKAGAIYLPIDPSHPKERVAYMLEDSKACKLLTARRLVDQVPKFAGEIICLDAGCEAITPGADVNSGAPLGGERPAYVIYTSGSTGKPKGVVASHRASLNRFAWMWNAWGFSPGEVCCQKTALGFVDSVWEIFGPLLQGVPTIIVPEEEMGDLDRMVQTLCENKVSRIVLVPSLLRVLLESVVDLEGKLPELKLWVTSGETLAPELARRFAEVLPGARLMNLYGSSEVAGDVTAHLLPSGRSPHRVPIGRPIANTQIYILDRQLNPVPMGIAGEICVGGDNVAIGYLNHPELTSQKFLADPFAASGGRIYRTGDLGRFQADGTIEFLGRRDTQVKIRGIRIELGEIESILRQYPGVREAAAVVSGSGGDERLAAYLVRDPAAVLDEIDLRRFLRTKLPDHLVPVWFETLDALPLTSSGKLDRRALSTRIHPPQGEKQECVAPRNATEAGLLGIVTEVLGIERAGIHDNFFELGGHSLRGMQVIARIRKRFHVDLPLRKLFDEPTVAGLSVEIEKASKRAPGAEASSTGKRVELLSRERLLARLNQLSDAEVEALLGTMPGVNQGEQGAGDI